MKLPDVSGVYDYAGPSRNLRCRSRSCCLPPMQKRQRPDCIFSKLNTQPACTPVYASPCTSRYPTQNSGPSGSLLLSRRTLPFPASCRFSPAHRIGDLSLIEKLLCEFAPFQQSYLFSIRDLSELGSSIRSRVTDVWGARLRLGCSASLTRGVSFTDGCSCASST
jgi:hypothetical protein